MLARRRWRPIPLLAALALGGACPRSDAGRAPVPEAAAAARPLEAASGGALAARLARALPDGAPPFTAGPLLVEAKDGYARRRYERGAVAAEITVAARPQTAAEFADWEAQSRDYPQAALALPPSAANGFFTCAGPGTQGACDLHIQMRAGFHVEVMSGGHATRADLDQLMARIPLAALVDR